MYLTSIIFCQWENTSSCYLHKHLLPKNGKQCPLFTSLEYVEKGKVTTRKILVLKYCSDLDFHSEYYIPAIIMLTFNLLHVYIIGKIILQVNSMTCLCVNTIITTGYSHVITQKNVWQWVKKFNIIIYIFVSPCIWRGLRSSTLINWNHKPYLWHNLILIYQMKVINIIALL